MRVNVVEREITARQHFPHDSHLRVVEAKQAVAEIDRTINKTRALEQARVQ
jgi:hypothetical protein